MWTQFNCPERANRFQKTLNREAEEHYARNMRDRVPPNSFPYFSRPSVYVVLLGSGPDGGCKLATDSTPQCEAILGFLSPIDAHIEGILRAKPGLGYEVRQASRIPERYFWTRSGDLALLLHISRLALDRRFLLRPSGIPCRVSRPVDKDARDGMPATFEVDAVALDEVDHMYERAGLYAWEETHERPWPAQRAAQFALRMGYPLPLPPDANRSRCELALFDPEGACWHYLPEKTAQEPPAHSKNEAV